MGGVPKQYRPLGDAPVLVQTLRVFDHHPQIGRIVVASDDVALARETLDGFRWTTPVDVVEGGATRQDSVRCGLDALAAEPDDALVLVHDAARPFLPATALADVLQTAAEDGAAALAVPVADTLRRGEAGVFSETVPRDGLWRMQTPQAFRLGVLRAAHERFGHVAGTDEVELVQRLGRAVGIVTGSPFNLKLTTPEDWAFAERLWPVWSAQG
jgi:2-C-methyl-D-erythritol 4-phosphate cytidylyltransferase